ncbi:MAG: nucleotidyltransferase family protein [Comamonadaceae bacterium]|nr:nucleotidyltransferase family protein [Comamonadaceae bacterium]
MVRRHGWLVDALAAVRSLGPPSWCIGAGAVRDRVWDELHGVAVPSRPADVDVAWFDAANPDPGRDAVLQERLAAVMPCLAWDVTNQAGVHRWLQARCGRPVAPFVSLEDGVASWPEFATCVGVRLEADGSISVVAPHGLGDLFGLVVRHNPARAGVETFRARLASKRFAQRWPRLTVVEA